MMNDNLYDSRAWRMLVARYGEREAHAIVYYVMEVASPYFTTWAKACRCNMP